MSHLPHPSNQTTVRKSFILGVVAGVLFSIIFYVFLIAAQPSSPILLFGAVGLKVLAGIGYCFIPAWKPFGVGLIASIPIGLLIFMTLCFGAVIAFS